MRSWKLAVLVPALLLGACAVDPPQRRPVYKPAPVPAPASRPAPASPRKPVPGAPATTPVPLPPAPADERDRPPGGDEIPANIGDIPDAVPEAVEKSRYGNPDSYEVFGVRYDVLANSSGFKERGHASWYGKKFHGRRTSSGEVYDMFAMSGAHKTLPIPTYARVTNLGNGKSVVVRINDRGPFHKGRIVDLSYSAAHKIGLIGHGSAEVELEVVDADSPMIAEAAHPAAPPPPRSTPVPVLTPGARAADPPAVAVPVSRQAEPRYLQAGSFSDARNAGTFRERLAVSGIRPLLMKSETRNNKWVYRVLVGPFQDAASLNAMRRKLAADETSTILVSE